jgi:hypothetical protein
VKEEEGRQGRQEALEVPQLMSEVFESDLRDFLMEPLHSM